MTILITLVILHLVEFRVCHFVIFLSAYTLGLYISADFLFKVQRKILAPTLIVDLNSCTLSKNKKIGEACIAIDEKNSKFNNSRNFFQ